MADRSVKLNSKEIKIHTRNDADDSVFEEIFLDRDYKIIEEKFHSQEMPTNILDIGAHTGMFSVYAATFNSEAKIFAFEPEESNFQQLKKHCKDNHLKNITSKNLAVSNHDGEIELQISEDSHNHSLYIAEDSLNTKKVRSISLERIFSKFKLSRVALAKIDCEGAEFEIILDSDEEILTKIDNFIIEYHQFKPEFDPQKLINKLRKLGYKTQKFPSKYDKRMGMISAFRKG